MKACADKGVLCVLIEMPFNLAVLDMNAAEGIRVKYPEIENWYIGGHSLGGSMAASYLSKMLMNLKVLSCSAHTQPPIYPAPTLTYSLSTVVRTRL